MRALGLDVGERRIGVAISDPDGRVAVPKTTLQRDGREMAALETIVREEAVELVVIGLPLALSGEEGAQAAASRAFGDAMTRRVNVPCAYWDERLSSVAAERLLGGERRAVRERIDAVAATLVLQSYLDSVRDQVSGP